MIISSKIRKKFFLPVLSQRLGQGHARVTRTALEFERHQQRIGRPAVRLREREAESFAVGADERGCRGVEAPVGVAFGAAIEAQREFVGTVEMSVAGPGGADDLTVERTRQEVIPAQVDDVRGARELEGEIAR